MYFCSNILDDNNLSKDEKALKYIEYKKELSLVKKRELKKICRDLDISYSAVRKYMSRHNTCEEETIKIYVELKQSKTKRLKEMCKKYGVYYKRAYSYMKQHPELTVEKVIEYYINTKEKTFSQKCIDANIEYHTAVQYRGRHPELTDEQVLLHFRPDCYINLLGELVIPE